MRNQAARTYVSKKMKPIKFLSLVCVLLIVPVMFFASCEKKTKGKDYITIGLVVPSLSHPFFVHLKANVLDESEKLGVKIIAADAEDAAAKQMSIVEDFIARGVDGVVDVADRNGCFSAGGRIA